MVPALAKGNVAVFTEALQHHLRNTAGGRASAGSQATSPTTAKPS